MVAGVVTTTAPTTPASDPTATGRPSLGALTLFGLTVCGPAAFTVYLAFRSGGFFAGAPAIVAVVLAVALMLRLTLAESPFAGFGPAVIWAIVGLGCYAVWTLLSALWSHAPAQAMIAFDRVLMYWLALVLFSSFAWTRERLLWAVRLLAGAMFAVAVLALITRILPGIHSVPAGVDNERLSYPLSYWNALGIFTTVPILLCVGLSMRREEPPISKALSAAAVPILVATLYFTFSRGAIGALFIGVVVFVVLAGRREIVTSAIAIVPTTLVALLLCLGTDALSTGHFEVAAGVAEGHNLAWELLACTVVAGGSRYLLRPLDRRLDSLDIPRRRLRAVWTGIGAAALIVVAVGAIAIDAPQKISEGFESFTGSQGVEGGGGGLQERLTSLNNDNRISQWELAVETFGNHPLQGSGAGTYARIWAAEGTQPFRIVNVHSLYLEALSELGLPGLIFLVVGVGAIFVGLARRIRGPDRIVYAALFAAALTWALHAGVDWDWEMPATAFFIFGLGGTAIAARSGEGTREGPVWLGRPVRVALGIGSLVLAVSPALVAISQGYLDSAVRNLQAGNCRDASSEALDAIHVLSVRPEPYQVLGFCDSRAGQHELAVTMLETAVDRDKGEWESYYGLALVKAVAGQDPRPAARKAYEMAPHEPLAVEGFEMFRSGDPQIWKRRALSARLPIL
jgi:O-antigen ligase